MESILKKLTFRLLGQGVLNLILSMHKRGEPLFPAAELLELVGGYLTQPSDPEDALLFV